MIKVARDANTVKISHYAMRVSDIKMATDGKTAIYRSERSSSGSPDGSHCVYIRGK